MLFIWNFYAVWAGHSFGAFFLIRYQKSPITIRAIAESAEHIEDSWNIIELGPVRQLRKRKKAASQKETLSFPKELKNETGN
jgi:hypothetical protein